MRQRGAVVSGVLAVLAAGGLAAVFVANASPYLTISEVATAEGAGLHVAGDLDKSTLRQNLSKRESTFTIRDQGQSLKVVYRGKPQPNIANATKVVVIGKMEAGQFVASDMLLKCPSKYESTSEAGGRTPAN